MSRDLCNHVLCRVGHLVNRIVVFLESRVFSSLVKLLQHHAGAHLHGYQHGAGNQQKHLSLSFATKV